MRDDLGLDLQRTSAGFGKVRHTQLDKPGIINLIGRIHKRTIVCNETVTFSMEYGTRAANVCLTGSLQS